MKRSSWVAVKWIVYIAILFILSIIQATSGLFEFFGAKINLLIPYAICIAMHENEKAAAVIGALAGAFWDSHTTKFFGFSSIILMLCCVAVSLLVMYLIKSNIINSVLFCLAALAIYNLFEYVFHYLIWSYEDLHVLLLKRTLPDVVITLIFTPLIFILIRKLSSKFQIKTEVK